MRVLLFIEVKAHQVIVADMRLSSARLASRIYGDVQKEITRRRIAVNGNRNNDVVKSPSFTLLSFRFLYHDLTYI